MAYISKRNRKHTNRKEKTQISEKQTAANNRIAS
jgi:hypothetical protein